MESSSKNDSPGRETPLDVAVIGSGFAGLSAAIEAHNAGAGVKVFEKAAKPGGNSALSGGGVAAVGTERQSKAGIEDSVERMSRDMIAAGLGLNYPELVHALAAGSNDAFKWLEDYVGVKFRDRIDIFGGHSVRRCYTPEGWGAAVVARLLEKVNELGIPVETGTRFRRFIMDESGAVCGVNVAGASEEGPGRDIPVGGGVVLATGGYGADVAFRSAQDPRLDASVDTTNQPQATAEALIEALGLGATPVQLSHIQTGPWASPDETGYGEGPMFSDYVLFQYGIILDPATGQRIINELADRKIVSDALFAAGRPCIGIADSGAVERSGWRIGAAVEKDVVRKFGTVAELASFYGMPVGSVEQTVSRFNTCVENGLDSGFGKPILDDAQPIAQPPFYGVRLWPKVHYVMGGLRINTSAQVIDLGQRPIKGLYAAGEVTGGVHGASRLGSCAITDCIVFGRIAGRNAAQSKKGRA